HLSGTGSIDLGPTHVELDARGLRWAIDGVRVLTPGTYRIDTPVAVGSGGLAHPADSVTFTATGDTTITTHGIPPIARGIGPVHLSGPGTLHATGQLTIRTRKGTTAARQLTFGPGPFLVDLGAGGSITATFNGPLTSQ
ncbi:MAG: hypothetical protein QOI47_267, partial [Actinomycetota bacterium]|nr:hypothetical protein [Actinomycetota bacterium]